MAMTTASAAAPIADMERFLELLHDGSPFEVRALNTAHRGVVSGYYRDPCAAVRDVARSLERSGAEGVYVTLNVLNPDVVARSNGRLRDFARSTTADGDIQSRRWLLLDFDAMRPSGISATDAEAQAALERAAQARDELTRGRWPEPLVIASGNGAHLLYRVDLPNDVASQSLISSVLRGLAARFDDDRVHLDTATANAARITKLVGTWARKGDDLPERPHRRARLLSAPDSPAQVVSGDVLMAAAAPARPGGMPQRKEVAVWPPERTSQRMPQGTSQRMRAGSGSTHIDELGAWLDACGVTYREKPDRDGVQIYELERCPWADHADPWKAYALRYPSGSIAAGCHADKCQGRGLHDLRDALEPGWRDQHRRELHQQRQEPQQERQEQDGEATEADEADEADEDAAVALVPHAERFPVEALPKAMRQFVVEAAAATSCAIEYVALPALVAAASAIGSTHEVELKPGWCERATLWGAVIGDTGTAKSPAMRIAIKAIDERQRQLDNRYRVAQQDYEEAQQRAQRGETVERLPRPVRQQVKTTDATVEALADVLEANPRGVLMARDELSALTNGLNQYRGGKGADREFYLSSWAGASALINRRLRSVALGDACLSIVGAIPPGALITLNGESGREDGFIHRFLFAWPGPVKHRWTETVISPEVEQRYRELYRQLFQLQWAISDEPAAPRPRRLGLTPSARVLFIGFYDTIHEEAESAETPVAMRGPLAKMPVQVARLALTLHVWRREAGETQCDEIDGESMRAAISLARYFVATARRVYANLTTRPEDAHVVKFLEWMREHRRTRVSARELIRARIAGVSGTQAADDFIANLVERNLGVREEEHVRGGRRITFTLRPARFVDSFDSSTDRREA